MTDKRWACTVTLADEQGVYKYTVAQVAECPERFKKCFFCDDPSLFLIDIRKKGKSTVAMPKILPLCYDHQMIIDESIEQIAEYLGNEPEESS